MPDTASLLLVTHVHMRQGPRGLQIDEQTAAGIEQWCHYFDSVTYYGIMAGGRSAEAGSTAWVDTNDGLIGARATFRALPYAYNLGKMVASYRPVRAELRRAIAEHRHLCFTLGSVIGDWPCVAALEAIGQKRRYSAWIDRVEPAIIRTRLKRSPVKRLAAEIAMPFAQGVTRYILRKSAVALLQGGDTFDYYARSAPNPHCTYDTHTRVEEEIAPDALARKQARVVSGAPLNIIYAGRATAMKGPFDWLQVLERLHRHHVPFRATWIGDGPDLPAIRQRVADLGLTHAVDLPGFENRRDILLQQLRDSELLLFCHKTPESARCLIEALVCGCPIVGYDTSYPRRLTAQGGGVLAPRNNVAALARRVMDLHQDRTALSQLIVDAAASGTLYSENAVYGYRAELMRLG